MRRLMPVVHGGRLATVDSTGQCNTMTASGGGEGTQFYGKAKLVEYLSEADAKG